MSGYFGLVGCWFELVWSVVVGYLGLGVKESGLHGRICDLKLGWGVWLRY